MYHRVKKSDWEYELTIYIYRARPYQSLKRTEVHHSHTKDGIMDIFQLHEYTGEQFEGRVAYEIEFKKNGKPLIVPIKSMIDIINLVD